MIALFYNKGFKKIYAYSITNDQLYYLLNGKDILHHLYRYSQNGKDRMVCLYHLGYNGKDT